MKDRTIHDVVAGPRGTPRPSPRPSDSGDGAGIQRSEDRLAGIIDERLRAEGTLDAAAYATFVEAQRRAGLTHGDRPLCRYLRPFIIGSARYERVVHAAELIVGALEAVGRRALIDDAIAEELGLTADERALAAIDPGYPQGVAVGRLDALITDDGFHFIEMNADSPAGIVDQCLVSRTLGAMPHVRPYFDGGDPDVRTPRPHDGLLAGLRQIHAAWGGGRPLETIAIVDWADGDTAAELRILAQLFSAAGHRTTVVDPGELTYQGGRLRAARHDVDLVYRRVIMSELLARGGPDHVLLRAYRDGAVCVANSPRTKAINKKAAFSILSDPRFASLFSPEQRDAIAAHIPWTRRVRSALTPALRARRERLVLKPNDEYGGKGVMLGWRTAPDAWAAALESPDLLVAQERRDAGIMVMPTYQAGRGIVDERVYFDFCPFVFAGRAEGAVVRLSSSEVSNVSAGGGVTGVLVIREAESS